MKVLKADDRYLSALSRAGYGLHRSVRGGRIGHGGNTPPERRAPDLIAVGPSPAAARDVDDQVHVSSFDQIDNGDHLAGIGGLLHERHDGR